MADHSFHEVISSYIAGLRSRQPRGPYHLGGWSAGGILAYAIAQELLAAGEKISSLLLIDSPPPTRGLDRLPDRFFDHCTSVGLFGTEMQRGSEPAKPPEWLMPHFRAQIELLHDYRAPPMPAHLIKDTKITIVWAGVARRKNPNPAKALGPKLSINKIKQTIICIGAVHAIWKKPQQKSMRDTSVEI